MRKILFGYIFIALALFAVKVAGQESINIERLTATVEFDGMPDEAAWEGMDFFPLKMNRPNFGNEPSERSEVMLAYDNEYLWVGARLYMRDPKRIFVNSKKRDTELFGSDCFGILIDSYDDNENALVFYTTPSGLRTDYAVSNDATESGGGGQGPPGMGAMNYSWNTFWDVKTMRDDKGWYLEMRIPFSSIRFKPKNDKAAMGLIISRTISANNETDTWPAIDPKYGFMATNKPSLASTIIFEGARPSRPVYVSPYVIGGYAKDWVLDSTETLYIPDENPQYNIGLDIKYSINSNLTLDLTANTDFAQVEADDQQVNLTRYDLFFPEKRMFFQERSSLFSFGLGGMSDLFYSRKIGMTREGDPIRIFGGARLTGRVGKWDVGLMDMQTAEYEETPSENFGVMRMRRQVINPNSYMGGIFTSRLGMNGEQNFAYGLDGIFKLFGDDYLSVKGAQTYDKEIGNKLVSLDPSFFMIQWERRSEKGIGYSFNYSYLGQEFTPGIGFVPRPGMQGFNGDVQYGWMPGEQSKWFSITPKVMIERYTRLADGELESLRLMSQVELETKKEIGGEISLEYQREGVIEDFPISDSIWIKAGEYSFVTLGGDFRTPQSKRVSVFLMLNGGEFFDGRRYGVLFGPNLTISSGFQLSAQYEYNALRFPDRQNNNSVDIHMINMKALLMLNTKFSASILAQYVNTEDDFIFNFRFRYNPREGNDFYIVYNENRGFNGHNEFPVPPAYNNRTIMLKYTHTFIL